MRIPSEAAVEALEAGATPSEVTPFWRVIAPNDRVASKLKIDSEWIRHQRESEQ